MGDEDFPEWMTERIGECAARLEAGLVERGVELSDEEEAAGAAEAESFVASETVPDCPKRCAVLFPRMWAAKTLLDASLLRPKLQIWLELDRDDVLQILLIETWPTRGRAKWEKGRPEGFKWG